MTQLEGKTAVVTGASRGIGRATAIALAREGAKVIAGARKPEELEALAAEHAGIRAATLDVREPASVRQFADKVLSAGEVDILVNNAGVGWFGRIEDIGVEDWDRVFEVNVRGSFLVTQALLSSIRARRGHVLCVTSDVSARAFAGGSLYAASKHAQRAFCRALQMELAPHGVRVTEIRPGSVGTAFAENAPRAASDEALAPEDIADAIVYAAVCPGRLRVDEILLHPAGQEPEF